VELPNTTVLGTIDKPVHAQSLSDAITVLDKLHDDHLIIAVDACLGKEENVGNINVRPGPLRPGSGVNKTLPEVGDLHIIGIVNIGGYLEQLVLQTTRLALVMQMADIVSKSLFKLCRERYVITQQEIGCNKEVAAGSSDI
jgi:putative sporulation protein YyaC